MSTATLADRPTAPDPCPECAQGKCGNCTDLVLVDIDLYDMAGTLSTVESWESCPCAEAGHPA